MRRADELREDPRPGCARMAPTGTSLEPSAVNFISITAASGARPLR
jgi:hypothetical protein